MPYKERKIKKKYYSIGEVSDQLNLNTSLIRYWESEFEVLNPDFHIATITDIITVYEFFLPSISLCFPSIVLI